MLESLLLIGSTEISDPIHDDLLDYERNHTDIPAPTKKDSKVHRDDMKRRKRSLEREVEELRGQVNSIPPAGNMNFQS